MLTADTARCAPYEDAQGTVWIGKEEGLFRASSAGLELVVAGMQVRSLYSDRDGNLWVGTNGDGLYRFKVRATRMFTTNDGLPNNVIMTVHLSHERLLTQCNTRWCSDYLLE